MFVFMPSFLEHSLCGLLKLLDFFFFYRCLVSNNVIVLSGAKNLAGPVPSIVREHSRFQSQLISPC